MKRTLEQKKSIREKINDIAKIVGAVIVISTVAIYLHDMRSDMNKILENQKVQSEHYKLFEEFTNSMIDINQILKSVVDEINDHSDSSNSILYNRLTEVQKLISNTITIIKKFEQVPYQGMNKLGEIKLELEEFRRLLAEIIQRLEVIEKELGIKPSIKVQPSNR